MTAIWDQTWFDHDDDDSDASDTASRELTQQVRCVLMPLPTARAINIRNLLDTHLYSHIIGSDEGSRVTILSLSYKERDTLDVTVTFGDGTTATSVLDEVEASAG